MIQKFFDVSTIHMPTRGAYKQLDCIIADYEQGIFLWIPMDDELELQPKWFYDICKLATANGCGYIRLDADGHVHEMSLKTYNW